MLQTEGARFGWIITFSILFILLALLLMKSKVRTTGINRFINYVSLLTVLVVFIVNIQPFLIRSDDAKENIRRDWEKRLSGLRLSNPGKQVMPDIYWIILDAYARQDVLREYYQFDNCSFI